MKNTCTTRQVANGAAKKNVIANEDVFFYGWQGVLFI